MISANADDICFAYDIPCGYDIWLRHNYCRKSNKDVYICRLTIEKFIIIVYNNKHKIYGQIIIYKQGEAL